MNRMLRYLAIGFLLIAGCGKGDHAPLPVTPVTFAVFGNTGASTDDGLAFSSLVGAINHQGVDFVIDLGNRLPFGTPSSGLDALWNAVDQDMGKFVAPVYPVAGTTDIFDSRSDVAYNSRYGASWYSFVRGGITFIVLNTADEIYSHGFGKYPRLGDEQIAWLTECMGKAGNAPVVLFMHHPLWHDAVDVWRNRLLPVLKRGNVALAVSCTNEGLMDWGIVDGIRAVSTGCVGPSEEKGLGQLPQAVLVTVNERTSTFRMLSPEGVLSDGIPITRELREKADNFVRSMQLPVLKSESSWRIGGTFDMKLTNPFGNPIKGEISFQVYDNTNWSIQPSVIQVALEPGFSRTFHVDIQGTPPELGPQPTVRTSLKVGDMDMGTFEETLRVSIPTPRTGNPVPIDIRAASTIPCALDGGSVRIPVDVTGADLCGRLVIYRSESVDVPVCIHVSNFKDFKPGVNEFVWNGCDMSGKRVTDGQLSYYVFAYNRKAPATWVADGPANLGGSFLVTRETAGLVGETTNDHALVRYHIGRTAGEPKAEAEESLEELLDGLPPVGFVRDGTRRMFISTRGGVVCVFTTGGKLRPDVSFAEEGYLRLSGFHGRAIGAPACGGGRLYVGIGGGMGKGPTLISVDSATGRNPSEVDLGEYYGTEPEPPALVADDRGVLAAHPESDVILRISPENEVVWMNEMGDEIGDLDSDKRSHVYGIGMDAHGMVYVNSPGTSARCGVIGPDGHGLFRIILVQLPGLRVSSVFPMIEGKPTDGLYLVTRGGDHTYVFHVPCTIRSGQLVKETRARR